MPIRELLIGLAIISIAAGVATWGIRTFQQPAYEATVVMSGLRYGPGDIGARNNRNRQVFLINDLELSELESSAEYRITSIRAVRLNPTTLMNLVVTSPSSAEAVAGANAVAGELLLHPLGDEQNSEPLEMIVPATESQPTSVPIQEAAATAVVVGVLGLAAIVLTRPSNS